MVDQATQDILLWLNKLVDTMPSDGRLTDEVLRNAGPLPIHVPEPRTEGRTAKDIVWSRNLNRVGAIAQFQGFVRSRLTSDINATYVAAHKLKSSNPPESARLELKTAYLGRIRDYVAGLG